MNTREVINKLVRKRVMDRLGVSSPQISNALADNEFPAGWFDGMDQLAQADGWQLPRELFAWRRAGEAA